MLDGTLPSHQRDSIESKGKILSTSMLTPVKDNLQRVCVIGNQDTLEKYKKYSGSSTNPNDEKINNGDVKPSSNIDLGKDQNSIEIGVPSNNTDNAISNEITFDTADTVKEVVSKTCNHCFNNNLTICHIDLTQKVLKLPNSAENELGKHNADFTDKSFEPGSSGGKTENGAEKKLAKKVRKMIKQLWSHTSKNGLFITVWPGTKTHNAFVGIAINKESI